MIKKLNLPIFPTEPLLIGVSGGADSVALLHALVQLGYHPHVCHLNHQWRGPESDADAEFVRDLAKKNELPVTIEKQIRDKNVVATEESGRRARLQFFESVAARTGIDTLALAHTADDQVETFLLRLLRGAATQGLVAMRSEHRIGSLRIVRPMLNVRRVEVLEYLRAHGLQWREDITNLDRKFLRNRVRHELLPLLEREYNPAIRDVLIRTIEVLREEHKLLAQLANADIESLHDQPVALQRRMLLSWLGDVGFDHIERVRLLAPGAEVTLPGDIIVRRDGEKWKIVERAVEPVIGRWLLNLDGQTEVPEFGLILFCHSSRATEALLSAESDGMFESFDADALGETPFVRAWQDGDRFQPLGMTGDKKLQDFFVDEKIPQRKRHRIPLLCASDGRIAWIVGHRIAEAFKIGEQTKRLLRVVVVPV